MKFLMAAVCLASAALGACSNGAPPKRTVLSADAKAAAATRAALQTVTTPISIRDIKTTVSLTSWTASANNARWACTADDEFRLPDCKPES